MRYLFPMIVLGLSISIMSRGRLNVMRRLKFCLHRKYLETIYLTFIRPILEYADVVWENYLDYEKQELDQIQTEAARIVTGATKLVSLHALFDEVNWEPLEARCMKHRHLLLYKMFNNLSPEYQDSVCAMHIIFRL